MWRAVLTQIYGENINKEHKLTGSEVIIGRNPKCHIVLSSPNISRKHCILTYSENGWRIKDNKSQNGTYINGRKLGPDEIYLLQRADIVFLGPPSEMPQGFSYDEITQYEENMEVDDDVDIVELPLKRACEQSNGISPSKIPKKVFKSSESDTSKKRTGHATDSAVPRLPYKVQQKVTNDKKRKYANPVSKKNILSAYDSGSDSESLVSSSKGADAGGQIHEISSTGNDHDENSESLIHIADNDEGSVFSQYSEPEGHWELDTETYRRNTQDAGKEKELESKLFLLSEQIKVLQESKLELLKNYNDVCEKNKELDQQLADKEKKLEDDFKQHELRAKNEVKSELLEKFEEDLVCNICTELFIKPTVLDCSHTFCEYCIKEWKKKKNDCPICRCKIKNTTRVRTLEEFIDKTLATLTPDQRVKRDSIIKERFMAEHPPPPDPGRTPSRRRNRRGQNRYRNNRTSFNTSVDIVEESSYPIPQVEIVDELRYQGPQVTAQIPIVNLSDSIHYQLGIPSSPLLRFLFT